MMSQGAGLVKRSMLVLLLPLLWSCPTPEAPSIPRTDPAPYLETEFLYDIKSMAGSISYSLDGSFHTAAIEEVLVYSENDELYSDRPQLCVDLFFEDVMAAVQLRLTYDSAAARCWRSLNINGDERFWICPFATSDHSYYQRVSSSGWNYTCTVGTEPDRQYVLDSLGFFFSGSATISGDYPISITDIAVQLDLEQCGYLLLDNASSADIVEMRQFDTSATLSSISTDVFSDPEGNLPLLVQELVDGISDPVMRIRVVHDWICSNVYYDIDALEGIHAADEQPLDVLASQRAVCEGLSLLMQKMCRMAGVDARIIYGRTQGQAEGTGHAWNAVMINGEYYLLDLTFDNRNYYDSSGETVPEPDRWHEGGFRSNYFLVKPSRFVESHYPWEDVHQFLDVPVTAQGFEDLSMHSTLVSAVYSHYHRLGIAFGTEPLEESYSASVEPVSWAFTLPAEYEPVVFLRSVDDLDNNIAHNLSGISFIQQNSQDYSLTVFPSVQGDYWLYLQADDHIDDAVYFAIIYLEKEGSEPFQQTLPLQVNPDYTNLGVVLASPMDGTLVGGAEYLFQLEAVGAANVILYPYLSTAPIEVGTPFYLTETPPASGIWQCSYALPANVVQLNVNIDPGGGSITVIKYQVE